MTSSNLCPRDGVLVDMTAEIEQNFNDSGRVKRDMPASSGIYHATLPTGGRATWRAIQTSRMCDGDSDRESSKECRLMESMYTPGGAADAVDSATRAEIMYNKGITIN